MTPPEMAGWNLALRFGLEMGALAGLATAGFRSGSGAGSWIAAIGLSVLAAAAWGIFNVPDDPSRSGAAPVVVRGAVRLVLEVAILGAGVAGFLLRGPRIAGVILGALTVFHYVASRRRVAWLLRS